MRKACFYAAIAAPLALVSLSAVAQASEAMTVSDCWVRSMPGNVPSAGYFTLVNRSDKAVDLVRVETDAFDMAMLHQTQSDGAVKKMAMLDKASVPARSTLNFAPNGYHVMFEEATRPLAAGSTILVNFHFSNSQKISTQCMVRESSAH